MSVSKAKTSWFSQCKNESQEEREREIWKREYEVKIDMVESERDKERKIDRKLEKQ